MPFTDLHSHIIPGFDDGASDDGEFLEMAEVALRGGTVLMAATPHYDIDSPGLELSDLSAAVEDHAGLLRSRGIGLELVRGVEVRINAGLFRMAKDGESLDELCLAGNGKYMLVDLPLIDLPVATFDILFQVQLRGVTPILAHPERNRYLAGHPSQIRDMVEREIEIQVNSGSLEGFYGRKADRIARALLEEGAARLLASDAHAPRGRSPDLSGAARIIRRRLGAGAVEIIMEENPRAVLDGGALTPVEGGAKRRGVGKRQRGEGRAG